MHEDREGVAEDSKAEEQGYLWWVEQAGLKGRVLSVAGLGDI